MKPPLESLARFLFFFSTLLLSSSAWTQTAPIQLAVDATDAPRKILHARLHIPARPGALTLLYPKWIPGEHSPNGPVADVVNLKFQAANQPVTWQRDPDDMFTFHLQIPSGVDAVDASFDFLLPPSEGSFSSGASSTSQLLDLSWNEVLLYPRGPRASALQYHPSLRLPDGWKFGTALSLARSSGPNLEFSPVSLETLVDSPVITGAWFRKVDLSPTQGTNSAHFLNIVADSVAALEIRPDQIQDFSRLVTEAGVLFGARHYRHYHFLLTLSDHVAHFGLEHHESSDNRQWERYLLDDETFRLGGFLLPHEMVHSWNGKFRRPLGLATPDFQMPMRGEMLWVYEGLTDYLGIVLATRSGIWTNTDFRDFMALEAARLDRQPGRAWRPLVDTATSAQLLFSARREGEALRRGVDFYSEGDLIWLEADVLIRQKSQGRRSLDNFCRRFFGGQGGPPQVVSYTFDDLTAALNGVVANDWREFFRTRVYSTNPRAPLAGIEGAGWRLGYTNYLSGRMRAWETSHKTTDLSFSLGLIVKEDGSLEDVLPDSPGAKAGIAPAMKLLAVNGRHWSAERLRFATRFAGTNAAPIELLVENEEFFKTVRLDYHDGEKYPLLERDLTKPDLLAAILRSSGSAK